MDNIKDYVELVKEPWGRMFYDLLFKQLDIPQSPKLNILDFGSGLCVTTNHFAAWHDVTAIEPNEEMIVNRYKENKYTQIQGGIEELSSFANNSFDIVFCHNVLEYVENKEPIISELLRVLKSGGLLSIVKHNRVGRVFAMAVFGNDPKKALALLDSNANDRSNYLGTQYIYSNDYITAIANKYGGVSRNIIGLRAFYALGQDDTVKYTNEWYENMLMLESVVASVDEFKNAAFFNHVFIEKHK